MSFDFTKLNRLPSIPVIAIRLLERLSNQDIDVTEIADIIQSDPAITAKILRASGSSQFGPGRPVTDLHRAVNVLGLKNVTSLALCFSLSDDSMRNGPFAALYKSVWLRSILQGTTTRLLSHRVRRSAEGEFFTAGLLAEIGSLAMLKAAPQDYAAMSDAHARQSFEERSLDDELAISCDGLSQALLQHWNLSIPFGDAIRGRRLSLEELKQQPPSDARPLVHAVALATAVSQYFLDAEKAVALLRAIDLWTGLFEFPEREVDEFLQNVQASLLASSGLFDTDPSQLGAPAEIMADAMEQLGRLATAAPHQDHGGKDDARSHLLDENGQLKRRVQDLLRRSTVDSLTQVYNRGHFDQALAEWAAVATVSKLPLGLLFVDADHFKRVNDAHGHAVGDEVLKRIAGILSQTVRGNDLVARYGGEEFVVLLAEPRLSALHALAERLRAAVEAMVIRTVDGSLRVTISMGGALFEPPHQSALAADILKSADAAVYTAKANGRNRVEIRQQTTA